MKKILKKHWLVISIFLIIAIVIIQSGIDFKNNIDTYNKQKQQIILDCNHNMNTSNNQNYINYCKEIIQNKDVKVDFFTMLTELIVFSLRSLNYLGFAIVTIPTIINLSKILKNKYIINSSVRESYKSFLKKFYKVAYNYIWILPLIGFVILLICLANTTLDTTYAEIYSSSAYSQSVMLHPIQFMICYLLNNLIYAIIFINLSLVVVRKKHNWIVASVLSILLYIGIELFFEVFINGILCGIIFKSQIGHLFNIMNPFTFSDNQYSIFTLMIFAISILAISSILVYISYKDKEKLIISCEKNN